MRTTTLFALSILLVSDRGYTYTLKVTSCDQASAGVNLNEDVLTFSFCGGGTYCEVLDEIPLPPSSGIEEDGATTEIPVNIGYIPTTMEINTESADAWCIDQVVWEDGDNLLGQDGMMYLDAQTGEQGCFDGLHEDEVVLCQSNWRFFNVDASSDYMYEVLVEACASTSTSTVMAYFCSSSECDRETGEEISVELEMGTADGGRAVTSFSSGFNPLAVRLEMVDESWCAERLVFNGFPVIDTITDIADFNVTDATSTTYGSIVFRNVQENGVLPFTPAPVGLSPSGEADDSNDRAWLDAAWEVAVTVLGAAVVAAGAACGTFLWRRNRSNNEGDGRTASCCRPIAQGEPSAPSGSISRANHKEERAFF